MNSMKEKDTGGICRSGNYDGSRIAMCNWIYRIPAGSDSDSDRNLGTDECSRTASGSTPVQSEP